ncbi:hypothetical protein WJX72_010919 [[Myrmecia] bisecta]|uniref:Protein kinase domain-containing protein n=1 Tax=[Myrmecia] bisecta TaxID=41462 RepID=A0AAW1R9U2_9CHLO
MTLQVRRLVSWRAARVQTSAALLALTWTVLLLRPVQAATAPAALRSQTAQVDGGLDLLDDLTAGANGVYSYTLDGSGVRVYTMDRGAVRATHVEFQGASGQSRASNSGPQQDTESSAVCNTVATHAASLVAGVATGVAKNASVEAVPWLPCEGVALKSDAIAALDWVRQNAAHPAVVLLMSSAQLGSDSEATQLQRAVADLLAANVTVVAAAGLFGQDECDFYPGLLSASGVITVGGVDSNLTVLAGSDYGACIDVYAPGADVYGASSGDDQAYRLLTGNVPAAAFAAGVAAQLLQQAASPDSSAPAASSLPPLCSGFRAQYYQVGDTAEPFPPKLAFQAPNPTRIDNWIWFPAGDACPWDLPWPSYVLSPMVALYTGYMYISPGLDGLFRFEALTGGTLRLTVGNATIIDTSAADSTCAGSLRYNQGQLMLSAGYHSMQVEYFQLGDHQQRRQDLELWFARVDVMQSAGQTILSDQITWFPLGGSTDLGLGGSGRVVFLSASGSDVQTAAAPVSTAASINCPNGLAGNDYAPFNPSAELFTIARPAGRIKPTQSGIESGGNELYDMTDSGIQARVNGFLAPSQQEMLQQWSTWHSCQPPLGDLPAMPADVALAAPFPASPPPSPPCYPPSTAAQSPPGDDRAVNITVTVTLVGQTPSTFTPALRLVFQQALATAGQVPGSAVQIVAVTAASLQAVAGRHLLQTFLQVVSLVLTPSPYATIVNLYEADTAGTLAASLQQNGALVYVPQSVTPVDSSAPALPTAIESATGGGSVVVGGIAGTAGGSNPGASPGPGSSGNGSPPAGSGSDKLSNPAVIAGLVVGSAAFAGFAGFGLLMLRHRQWRRVDANQAGATISAIGGLASTTAGRLASTSRLSVSPLGLRARAHSKLTATIAEPSATRTDAHPGSTGKPEMVYASSPDSHSTYPGHHHGSPPDMLLPGYEGGRRASGPDSLAALARLNSRRHMTLSYAEDSPVAQPDPLIRGVSGAHHIISEAVPTSRGLSGTGSGSWGSPAMADTVPLLLGAVPGSTAALKGPLLRRTSSQTDMFTPYAPSHPLLHARSLGPPGSSPQKSRVRFATMGDEPPEGHLGPHGDPEFDMTMTNPAGVSAWSSLMASRQTTESKEVEDMYSTLRANFVSILQYQSGRTHDITLPHYCIHHSALVLGEQIGEGGFSTVYEGTYNGTPVAIKKFKDIGLAESRLQQLNNEAFIMSRLDDPNIVRFHGAVFERPHYAMVLQFCQRGSVYRRLHDDDVELPWTKRYMMALNVADGMAYLHGQKQPKHPFGAIVHGDLKSTNLLLDDSDNVVICDFGLANFTTGMRTDIASLSSDAGSLAWAAPEVMEASLHIATMASDVYAYGMVLYELASRHVPFEGLKAPAIRNHVINGRRPTIPDNCPAEFAELISLCWSQQSEARPSFAWIVQTLQDLLHVDGTTSSL